jgi:hypothetical protein
MTALPLAAKISYQLTWPLRVIGIAGSVALLLFIFELVRRRQLKEEYTVLWVLTGLVLLLLAAWEGLLRKVAEAIGASSEASMLYFFGLIFVVFLLLHFSVRVSRLERRVLSMVQEIALLGVASPSNGSSSLAGANNARAVGNALAAGDASTPHGAHEDPNAQVEGEDVSGAVAATDTGVTGDKPVARDPGAPEQAST